MTPSDGFGRAVGRLRLSLSLFAVMFGLAVACIVAVLAPAAPLFHVEAFPLYAVCGLAYTFALVFGGEGVLREEVGETLSGDARRAMILVRVISGISFIMAALHEWSTVFPWLQGVYLTATDIGLSLGIAVAAAELLLRTVRRIRANPIVFTQPHH